MTLSISQWKSLSTDEQNSVLQRPATLQDASIRQAVEEIIGQVRVRGDSALHEMTKRYDNADVTELRVSKAEIAKATSELSKTQLAAIDLAINNVRCFHERQLPKAISVETMPGVSCERISHAIDPVGLYVPAGTAPLPSTAIMLAIPATIAGCRNIVLCTPPAADGTADSAVLAAASRAGVSDIYKVGGAQAVAAMAYGTRSIRKVSKIFGPGNAWVTCAKSLVSGSPDGAAIDMPAGPSEVLVVGDESASAEFVAADLLSQAEHGTDSQVIFVTNDTRLATEVQHQVTAQRKQLSRADIVAESLKNSRIILVDDLDSAIEISNRYAPEHLILHVDQARDFLPQIRNAGSVFLGQWSPESAGDYCSGTNHVLPTYGYSRAYSGLSVEQFMRQTTVQELSQQGLATLGEAVISLAGLEGLDAHAAAVQRRLRTLS